VFPDLFQLIKICHLEKICQLVYFANEKFTTRRNWMTRVAKHRHAVDTGYARGEETRARIVMAALRMFGERGFEAASTRDIATIAGVNAPALQYYFDNKEGLYLACVEHIVKRVRDYLGEALAAAERALADNRTDAELIEAYCAIQEQQAHFMFTSDEAADWRLFMARLQTGEGPASGFKCLTDRISSQMSRVLSSIVGRMLGRSPDDEETLVRTMMLGGQMHIFHFARRSMLAKLNWDTIDANRLALLKRVIRRHTSVLLRSMAKERDAESAVRPLPLKRAKKKAIAARH
jgi:TetR/AcrR family transcriptional regulator, regulator of cefoperazone and chloramphenicol sensitivity